MRGYRIVLLKKNSPMPANRASLAVVPSPISTANPEQDYFADGLAEDLIPNLARIRVFRHRTHSSFSYRASREMFAG